MRSDNTQPTESFDPYHTWLGIPPDEQPPNCYRLLGITNFENNVEVIDNAADRQMAFVRAFQSGPRSSICQVVLNEISKARLRLLDAATKAAYDHQLRESMAVHGTAPPQGDWSSTVATTTASRPTASNRRAALRRKNPAVAFAKVAAGGIVGIALATVILYFGFSIDVFGISKNTDDGKTPGTPPASSIVLPESPEDWKQRVRRSFAGESTIDAKNNLVTIKYDFRHQDQFKDFAVESGNARIAKNTLAIDGASKIVHKAKWKSLKVTATVGVVEMRGWVMSLTPKVSIGTGGNNPDTLYLTTTAYVIVDENLRRGPVPVLLQASEDLAVCEWGRHRLGTTLETPSISQLKLFGMDQGCSYAQLCLTGVLDSEWVRAESSTEK